MARRSQLRIAYSPSGADQTAFGTPQANGALTAVVSARATSLNHVEQVESIEDVLDCSGQYKIGETVLHRHGRLQFEINPIDLQALGVFTYYAGGVTGAPSGGGPFTHAITLVGPTVFTLPYFTLIVGFADGSDPGIKIQDCVVTSLGVRADLDGSLTARIEIVGKGDLAAAAGFTFPDCSTFTPLKMTDGAATLDGENLLSGTDANHTLRSFDFSLNNNILLADHPWPLASLDIKRLERADLRTYQLQLQVEGRLNDTLHTKAKNRTTAASLLRVGASPSAWQLNIPSGLIKPNTPPQGFEGEASTSVLRIIHDPLRVPGDATTPVNFSIINSQSGGYGG